jgi:hypothetical protein
MSLPATIPQAIIDTVLNGVALLFLAAAGDMQAARQAAEQMLREYHPETTDELTLAAEVISLQLHTLEALSHAATPGLPLNKILRLRGSAVSLSREQHKAHRKLDQLQRARRTSLGNAEPRAPGPRVETPIARADAEPPAPRPPAAPPSRQSFQKREAARIITENLRRKQAEHASQTAHRDRTAA